GMMNFYAYLMPSALAVCSVLLVFTLSAALIMKKIPSKGLGLVVLQATFLGLPLSGSWADPFGRLFAPLLLTMVCAVWTAAAFEQELMPIGSFRKALKAAQT